MVEEYDEDEAAVGGVECDARYLVLHVYYITHIYIHTHCIVSGKERALKCSAVQCNVVCCCIHTQTHTLVTFKLELNWIKLQL